LKKIRPYIVTLKHDAGRIRLEVMAYNIDSAIDLAMELERCPRRAIVGIKRK
jgi:hypothetical protein